MRLAIRTFLVGVIADILLNFAAVCSDADSPHSFDLGADDFGYLHADRGKITEDRPGLVRGSVDLD